MSAIFYFSNLERLFLALFKYAPVLPCRGFLYIRIMYEYRPAKADYIFKINYQDKEYSFRVVRYHFDGESTYYHLFARARVLDIKYNYQKKELTEELQHGQTPMPVDFLRLLEVEFKSMNA